MENEGKAIDETNEAADTDTSTEQHNGPQAADENSESSQAESESESTQTKPVDVHLNAIATVNQNLVTLREQFDRHIARNKTQQEMFDKFYQEMEANKEDALFEAFQKPVINNLIQLYDHFVEVEDQLEVICKTSEIDETQNVDNDNTQNTDNDDPKSLEEWFTWYDSLKEGAQKKSMKFTNGLLPIVKLLKVVPKDKQPHSQKDLLQFQKNLNFVRLELEEVLYRMNVTPNDEHPEELDLKLHKTVDTEDTDDEKQDKHVSEIRKIGFYWTKKEKQDQEQKQVIRREEVVIYRYQPSADEAKETEDGKSTNETDETTGENQSGNKTDDEGDHKDG